MRQANQRGGGSHSIQRGQKRSNRQHARKQSPLNCIVDEGALIAGLTDATDPMDNLKTWVREGAINVFVPLYTLEMLNTLRSSPPPLNLNARKTLEWLDHITSATENKTAGHVELQGPDDQYQNWTEVEKYLLPETPLSSKVSQSNTDSRTNETNESLKIDDGQGLGINDPSQSPAWASLQEPIGPIESIKTDLAEPEVDPAHGHTRGLSRSSEFSNYSEEPSPPAEIPSTIALETASIPLGIRPLLNYVVWRTHHENVSTVASGNYILLTNDPNTRKQAQQFGVRAKLLAQLRFIVARDRNKSTNNSRSKVNGSGSTVAAVASVEDTKEKSLEPESHAVDGEDEVVFSPRRPKSQQTNSPTPKVWDPDHFGRMPVNSTSPQEKAEDFKPAERGHPAQRRAPPHRGQSRPYRGKDHHGSRGSSRDRPRKSYEQSIDPDSFDRPQPSGRRGRGTYRKLWEPDG